MKLRLNYKTKYPYKIKDEENYKAYSKKKKNLSSNEIKKGNKWKKMIRLIIWFLAFKDIEWILLFLKNNTIIPVIKIKTTNKSLRKNHFTSRFSLLGQVKKT